MTDKDRKSVTVDPDVSEYLSREDVNASGLINQLVQNHMSGNGGTEHMLQLRVEQVESEIADIEDSIKQEEQRLARKQDELDQLHERLSECTVDVGSIMDEAANTLRESQLSEDNPAVQRFAEKADMHVVEFLDQLRDEMEN